MHTRSPPTDAFVRAKTETTTKRRCRCCSGERRGGQQRAERAPEWAGERMNKLLRAICIRNDPDDCDDDDRERGADVQHQSDETDYHTNQIGKRALAAASRPAGDSSAVGGLLLLIIGRRRRRGWPAKEATQRMGIGISASASIISRRRQMDLLHVFSQTSTSTRAATATDSSRWLESDWIGLAIYSARCAERLGSQIQFGGGSSAIQSSLEAPALKSNGELGH